MSNIKNGRKSKKPIMSMIMALLVVLVLFIPAITSWYIDDRHTTQILSVQGEYENGTILHPYEPVNQNQVFNMFIGEVKVGEMSNNDSYYLKHQGVDYINFTNFVSYIGNGNYTCTPNYTIHSVPFQWREIGIPLNITNGDIAKFDFIRLTSNDEHTSKYLRFRTIYSGGSLNTAFLQTSNDTYISINSFQRKAQLNVLPNEKIYLTWNGQTPTSIDDTDLTWQFKIEGYNLTETDAYFWSDEHLYITSMGIAFVILLVGFILTTDYIDIKFDTKRRK